MCTVSKTLNHSPSVSKLVTGTENDRHTLSREWRDLSQKSKYFTWSRSSILLVYFNVYGVLYRVTNLCTINTLFHFRLHVERFKLKNRWRKMFHPCHDRFRLVCPTLVYICIKRTSLST